MKEAVYSFSNSEGDKFYLRLAADSELFLSKEMNSFLVEKDFELWGIYLDRSGNVQKVTPMKLLNKVSQLIATFFIGHPNAILYYQCDDISDVPMSFKKKETGMLVQEYRNRLFTSMFEKIVRKLNVSVVDTPIYIDACGNDVYIHLMSREIHAEIAKIISKDIHQGFDK